MSIRFGLQIISIFASTMLSAADSEYGQSEHLKNLGEFEFRNAVGLLLACSTINARLYSYTSETSERYKKASDQMKDLVDQSVAQRVCETARQISFASCRSDCAENAATITEAGPQWSDSTFNQCVIAQCGPEPENQEQCNHSIYNYSIDYVMPLYQNHIELVDLEITAYPDKEKTDIARSFLATNCPSF